MSDRAGPRGPVVPDDHSLRALLGTSVVSSPGPVGRGRESSPRRFHRFLLFAVSSFGVLSGLLAGAALGRPLLGAVTVGLAAGATTYLLMRGRGGGALGSGRSPRPSGIAYAEALAAAGHTRQAVVALHLAAGEHAEDPIPCLRLAHMHRHVLADPEEAVRWLRKARKAGRASDAQWCAATREISGILLDQLDDPAGAAPELARLADRSVDAAERAWAEAELAAVKSRMRDAGGDQDVSLEAE